MANEVKTPIPARLYNAAVGGHVAGADDIIDDKTGMVVSELVGNKSATSEENPFNGMGVVILPMNIQEVEEDDTTVQKNILTQAMMNQTNTKYVIKYDYVLGEDITIPANCVLEFDGGSLSGNNKLTFSSTKLLGNPKVLCDFEGNITNGEINISWLGITPTATSQQVRFQKIIDWYANNVPFNQWDFQQANPEPFIFIPNGFYNFGTINIRGYLTIRGAGKGGTVLLDTCFVGNSDVYHFTMYDLVLKNRTKSVDTDDVTYDVDETTSQVIISPTYKVALKLNGTGAHILLEDVGFQGYDVAVYVNQVYGITLQSCNLKYNSIGFISTGISFGDSSHCAKLLYNTIGTGKYGVLIDRGAGVIVKGNDIEDYSYAIKRIASGGATTIAENYFESNKEAISGNLMYTSIYGNNFAVDNQETDYCIKADFMIRATIANNVFPQMANAIQAIILAEGQTSQFTVIQSNWSPNGTITVSSNLPPNIYADNGFVPNDRHDSWEVNDGGSFRIERNTTTGELILSLTDKRKKTYIRGTAGCKRDFVITNLTPYGLGSDAVGSPFFLNTDNKKIPVWWDGTQFVDATGTPV